MMAPHERQVQRHQRQSPLPVLFDLLIVDEDLTIRAEFHVGLQHIKPSSVGVASALRCMPRAAACTCIPRQKSSAVKASAGNAHSPAKIPQTNTRIPASLVVSSSSGLPARSKPY